MSQAILDHVGKASMKKQIPVLRVGSIVRVHQKISEGGKERVQIFEGLLIRIGSGSGINKTFTIRKVVDGVGVEKIFPFYSPNVKQIDVVKGGKVRRSKLYYMRERTGKSARLRDQGLDDLEMIGEDYIAAPVESEVTEDAAPESADEQAAEAVESVEATPEAEEVAEVEESTPEAAEVAEATESTPDAEAEKKEE